MMIKKLGGTASASCIAILLASPTLAGEPSRRPAPLVASTSATQEPGSKPSNDSVIPAEVDPRVELLSIVFRLIKANEYNQPSSVSAYSREAAAHFDKHAEHDAIKLAAKLRSERSIGYDAVAGFAAHLKDIDSCEFAVPLEPWPKTLDARWNLRSAMEFAQALKRFVRDSEFQKFWDEQKSFREIAESRMKDALARRPIKQWIESYFGVPLQPDSRVRIGLLNGGANYGSSVRYSDGRLVVFPTIGVRSWDSKGLPKFSDGMLDTIIHEFCHPFVNPLVDENYEQLKPAAEKLYTLNKQAMAAQAYGEPRTVMYESLVRASVARILAIGEGEKIAAAQQKYAISRGFWWTPSLVESLTRYEKHRESYPTLAKFMPELAADLSVSAKNSDAILDLLPKIVDISPKHGSNDLAPDVQFRIEFDRPMDRTSRALSLERGGAFKVISPGKFDDSARVFSTIIRFEPGTDVKAWINRSGMGWSTESGYAAAPRSVEFKIAADKPALKSP